MKSPKALVVEHEENTRRVIDETLLALGHKYEVATSLSEARELLATNGYAYILLNCMIPARPGGTVRRQNAENFLDDLKKLKGDSAPPVIIMFDPMPDVEEDVKVNWTCDLTMRGARRFIRKPFRAEGRTLDRVIKKVLAGQKEPVKLVTIPLITMRKEDAPTVVANIVPHGPLAPEPKPELPTKSETAEAPAGLPKREGAWAEIPNEPVDIDDFMVKFCEQRSKENRVFRKRALLAAARHRTIELPPLAAQRKHGQSNKYFAHDLLAAWQGYLDVGVDLPPLSTKHGSVHVSASQ